MICVESTQIQRWGGPHGQTSEHIPDAYVANWREILRREVMLNGMTFRKQVRAKICFKKRAERLKVRR
jgi:3-mercaptopyruvate sulfurtransferase SseA